MVKVENQNCSGSHRFLAPTFSVKFLTLMHHDSVIYWHRVLFLCGAETNIISYHAIEELTLTFNTEYRLKVYTLRRQQQALNCNVIYWRYLSYKQRIYRSHCVPVPLPSLIYRRVVHGSIFITHDPTQPTDIQIQPNPTHRQVNLWTHDPTQPIPNRTPYIEQQLDCRKKISLCTSWWFLG